MMMVRAYADVVCDLFHPGHLAFFAQCRTLADELVVGVHSDEDVATYKRRPIMSLEERVSRLQSCRLVDRVVANAPLQTTADWLDGLGADFVCHGDDIDAEQARRYYGDLLEAGRVRLVRYTRSVSTTEILLRMA